MRTYDNIPKTGTCQRDDYNTTVCLLDYNYLKRIL